MGKIWLLKRIRIHTNNSSLFAVIHFAHCSNATRMNIKMLIEIYKIFSRAHRMPNDDDKWFIAICESDKENNIINTKRIIKMYKNCYDNNGESLKENCTNLSWLCSLSLDVRMCMTNDWRWLFWYFFLLSQHLYQFFSNVFLLCIFNGIQFHRGKSCAGWKMYSRKAGWNGTFMHFHISKRT